MSPNSEGLRLCGCGCGVPVTQGFDKYGRRKRFVQGHNFRRVIKEADMEAEHEGAVEQDAPMDIKDSGEEATKDQADVDQMTEADQTVDTGGEE